MRPLMRPLVATPVTPNHLTTGRLITGLLAVAGFALGSPEGNLWGGIIWMVSALLDRADGELARMSGKTSPGGHRYDYICDVVVNGVLFLGIGIGLRDSSIGLWAVALGALTSIGIVAGSLLSEELERLTPSGPKAYSGILGFDFDDALYLFGPIAWLNWFLPILVAAAVCAPAIALITWVRVSQVRRNDGGVV